ncbi:M23 family metallopeptidase [Kribbella lupini]|uniref:M23ase beta-sheet core domain-containing protein n=1 Tax=Kribbella lupini TaxID=291602 RepID=A0ABP4N1J9_9ACTN
MAKHRSARRSQVRGLQLVGLTAALAAAAGTAAAGFATPSTSASAGTTLSSAQAEALTTARVERRDLGSRDLSRFELSLASTQKAAQEAKAAQVAKARAAQLAANATLTERRALALAAAKATAAKKAAAATQAAAAAKAAAEATERAAAAKRIVLPTTGYHLTARFGQGGSRWASNHTGLDFAAPIGTPVRSVLPGEVIQAEFAGAYGRQVKVRHADGTVTSYGHMSEFTVNVGDVVAAGTQVGSIGMSGNTTGPHVHFEVLLGGTEQIDPEPWLRDHGVNP